MTTQTLISVADALVARKVRLVWLAVLILIQKNAIRVLVDNDGMPILDRQGNKQYFYTGNGRVVSRKVILSLGAAGLVHMLGGQPRLTTKGTKVFYLFVNGHKVSLAMPVR